MKTRENIALIGMPAVGKSTVGVLLAKQLGYAFLDTDILIQTKENLTLAQIIEKKGLERFLDIEGGHVCTLEGKGQIIATGGSVIYREHAMAHLSSMAVVIYLYVDLNILLTRLSDLKSRGVAIDPGHSIEELYQERTPLYNKYCDVRIDCGRMIPAQVAALAVTAFEGQAGTFS